MKRKWISEAVGGISQRHIAEAADYQPAKRQTPVARGWLRAAACLLLVAVIGVSFALHLPGETPPAAVGPVQRHYQAGIQSHETAILWPWEYKTESEKYPHLTLGDTTYYALHQSLPAGELGAYLGSFEARGWDSYENDREYRKAFSVFAIRGMAQGDCVAVQMDGAYCLYATEAGRKKIPAARQYRLAGRVTEIGEGYFLLDDRDMCQNSRDGRVFRISAEDLRVSRCFAFAGFGLEVGSTVVVFFDAPIAVNEAGLVEGAVQVSFACLTPDGQILLPE